MQNMKMLDMIAMILLIIGGLNWGLMGIANVNLVSWLFGASAVANLVYILVGLSAVYKGWMWMKKS
jgi:uncharacterized protein